MPRTNTTSSSGSTSVRADGPLYAPDAARGEEQLRRMKRLEADGVCSFCIEHVATEQSQPIELEGEYWYVKRNDFPYLGTAAHYLIIARQHVTSFAELPDAAGADLWALKRRLAAQLQPLATATVERSGDMFLNGGSVAHLHAHFVGLAPDPEKTVRFRVSARATGDGG